MKNKKYGWLLVGILAGMIIGRLTIPNEVWGAEPVLQLARGQTVVEDMSIPNQWEVEEARAYLEELKIEVPAEIENLCIKYGEIYNIQPELLEAMIFVESSFQHDVVDRSGSCKGLMQVKTSAHQRRMGRLGVNDIYDPAGNIAVGSDYLSELLNDFDVPQALMLYNGDLNALKPGYLSGYAEKVMKISKALERVHYK